MKEKQLVPLQRVTKGKSQYGKKKYTQKHEEFNDNKHKEGQNRGLKSF